MFTSSTIAENRLEDYFSSFRDNIIGNQQYFQSPFGTNRILYADWTASGRGYRPIEEQLQHRILPFLGNTHTTTTITGSAMSLAYEEAKVIVKQHVNAGKDDVLLFCGSGMTSAVNKLQRILGLRLPEQFAQPVMQESERPVVFVTALEHHSNHISWLETIAQVEIIELNEEGNADLSHLQYLLEQHKNRKCKIAAITACSNVTGIYTPYHEIAKLIHTFNGWCFVDFACAAPYCAINMHPADTDAYLDGIYFSSHKFLGGPATPGILIFNKALYKNKIPDQPGGGTVSYTNPWGVHEYTSDIEQREDGGTPPFIQGIKAAMCIRLKEEMSVNNILQREKELLNTIFRRLPEMNQVNVLQGNNHHRLGVISFVVTGAHYNLVVKLLNDRFGIQVRGGCSCAGTYGHRLLNVDQASSYAIFDAIQTGDLSCKPGWVRLSIHPTMTNAEINFILDAIEITISNIQQWGKDYYYDPLTNDYLFQGNSRDSQVKTQDWFNPKHWT